MATITKLTYTRGIPKGANLVTKNGEQFARFKRNGRTIDAPLTEDGKKCRVETAEWYVRHKGVDGKWHRKKGYTDRQATEKLAVEIQQRIDRHQSGHADPFEEHHKRPLTEHLEDFRAALAVKGCEKHVRQVVNQARKVIDGCRFKRIADFQASRVQVYLGELRETGLSIQTCKHYLRAMKQFCRWLVKDRRTNDNPIFHLEPGNVETDRRRIRRALTSDEIERLLVVTAKSDDTFLGLDGADRFVLYYVAFGSGLRAAEVASLTPESFDLDSDTPMVIVEAGTSKRRRREEHPLQPDVAAVVREYIRDKQAGQRIWPGSWWRVGAKMLRVDLEAADIPYVDASGHYADFHAARHTYITIAAKHLPPKMAQALARHSTPTLTERYTHLELHDTAAAAAQLPPLMPSGKHEAPTLAATGTDDAQRTPPGNRWTHTCHKRDFSGHSGAQQGTPSPCDKPSTQDAQTVKLQRVDSPRHGESLPRMGGRVD